MRPRLVESNTVHTPRYVRIFIIDLHDQFRANEVDAGLRDFETWRLVPNLPRSSFSDRDPAMNLVNLTGSTTTVCCRSVLLRSERGVSGRL